MIFVDTGAWYSLSAPEEAHHKAAIAWMRSNRELLLTTDYVIDETLTLLRARGLNKIALALGVRLFSEIGCRIHYVTADDIQQAWRIFQRFSDKNWSFTDCTSKVVMEKLGLTQAFAFDQHFRQFGNIETVI